jgi:hypothetical protein
VKTLIGAAEPPEDPATYILGPGATTATTATHITVTGTTSTEAINQDPLDVQRLRLARLRARQGYRIAWQEVLPWLED